MGQETGNYYTDIFSPEELTKYPVTLGEGGGIVSLPPYVVSETGLGQGNYETVFGPGYGRSDLGFGQGPDVTLGGGGYQLPQPGGTGSQYAQPLPSSGKEPWTNIYNQELARLNEINAKAGKPPVSLSDTLPGSNQSIGEYLIKTADNGFQWENDVAASQAAAAARSSASAQWGIPIIFPLPVSPAVGAAITAAGLIGSKGQIATLDPNNPVGSVVGAATGTVGSVANAPNVIKDIFSGPTAAEAPEMGTGATQVNPIVVSAGAIGGNQGNSGTTSTDTGTSSTGSSVPVVGTGGQTTQTLSPDEQKKIVEQALSGVGAAGTTIANQAQQASDQDFWNKVLGGVYSTQQPNQPTSGQRVGELAGKIQQTGSTTINNVNRTDDTKKDDKTVVDNTNNNTTNNNSTAIVKGSTSSSYTPMATTVYQRNLPKELSTSSSALFGQIPLVNAAGQPTGGNTTLLGEYGNIYQNLLGQTMLGNAAQNAQGIGLTRQISDQLAADQAKLQRVQSGQLAAEDVRNAQQAAREAYGARGQVMGQGAIGAEILNREAIRQQRENEARAAYQASMQNAFNATQLQTGNIFSPVGSLVSSTFNPLAPYEADVYGTNVNALNADQIAAANRQAALESAKLGQTGTYAAALGTFLGSPTGNTVLKSVWDYFSGGGNNTPGT